MFISLCSAVITIVISLCKTFLPFPLLSGRGSTSISRISSLLLLDMLLSGSTVCKVFCFFFGCCSGQKVLKKNIKVILNQNSLTLYKSVSYSN
ncbi:11288_t:CDS:2 [Funneliformis mosseae]|uniref:11288_t:CDS:1 n=1 Tax=Funneliformis mosseae TaxID=27381 RepID=A0A9N9FQ98_FUNMO|nr:11288_t:CDS:2 [Funneliformis mosseae]